MNIHKKYIGVLTLISLTLINIALQLSSAALIKAASLLSFENFLLISVLLCAALTLSFGRFLIWGQLHKHFPVSITYPASALFFPSLMLLTYCLGEPVTSQQFLGVAIVTLGVVGLISPDSTGRRCVAEKVQK